MDLHRWVMQIILACFFSTGFVAYYHYVWTQVFYHKKSMFYHRWYGRIYLLIISMGIGFYLSNLSAEDYMTSTIVFYCNIALFALLIPLFYAETMIGEYILQCLGLGYLWFYYHPFDVSHSTNWLASIIVLGLLWMIWYLRDDIKRRPVTGMTIIMAIIILFWKTTPMTINQMVLSPQLTSEEIGVSLVMVFFACSFWVRQSKEDQANHELGALARYDTITNATTYEATQKEMISLFNEAKNKQQPLILASLDVDWVKKINDRYGHLAANKALIGIATLLGNIVTHYGRDSRIYQISGEEFTLIFPNTTMHEAESIIISCWEAIRKSQFDYEDNSLNTTISVGVVQMDESDQSIDDTYRRADDSLYVSKNRGRDMITISGKTLQVHKTQNTLKSYAFFAQKIVRYSTAQTYTAGYELLLRMYDADRERWVLPETFEIPVTTQITLIKRALACTTTKNVTINLTVDQFFDPAVATALTNFKQSSEGPDQLIVEIVDVRDVVLTRQISAMYRASGVKIFIDDVGSDNSFEMIHSLLPYVNGIKFAMQNLRKTNSPDQMYDRVKFWISVAREQKLEFILEGLETAEQVQRAHEELDIHLMQGYYFGKPTLPEKN